MPPNVQDNPPAELEKNMIEAKDIKPLGDAGRVDPLVGPDCEHGALALLVAVPVDQRANKADDIAEAYAVEVGYDIPGGCIVWGKYHGKWVANVSARWIVSRFIEGAAGMLHNESCGGDDWWKGCIAVMDLVSIQR